MLSSCTWWGWSNPIHAAVRVCTEVWRHDQSTQLSIGGEAGTLQHSFPARSASRRHCQIVLGKSAGLHVGLLVHRTRCIKPCAVAQADEMAAARGVQLPKELVAAAAAGGLYSSVLERYIQLQARSPLQACCSSCNLRRLCPLLWLPQTIV